MLAHPIARTLTSSLKGLRADITLYLLANLERESASVFSMLSPLMKRIKDKKLKEGVEFCRLEIYPRAACFPSFPFQLGYTSLFAHPYIKNQNFCLFIFKLNICP
jgi:hypothetical protein